MVQRILFAATIGLSALAYAETSWACSPRGCSPDTDSLLPLDGSTVPPNISGLAIRFTGEEQPDFILKDESTDLEVEHEVVGRELHLLGALASNTTYRIDWIDSCGFPGNPSTSTFQTGPENVDFPESLGVLASNHVGLGRVRLSYDGCETEDNLSDRVEIDLVLSATAEPWKDVLIFQTTVNGVPWSPSNLQARPPGASWVGRAKDLIYLDCESPYQQNLKAGVHTVQMEARLPGDDRVLLSNSVEVSVHCDTDEVEAVKEVEEVEREAADGEAPAPESGDSGCSTTGGSALWVFLLFGLVGFRRRCGV